MNQPPVPIPSASEKNKLWQTNPKPRHKQMSTKRRAITAPPVERMDRVDGARPVKHVVTVRHPHLPCSLASDLRLGGNYVSLGQRSAETKCSPVPSYTARAAQHRKRPAAEQHPAPPDTIDEHQDRSGSEAHLTAYELRTPNAAIFHPPATSCSHTQDKQKQHQLEIPKTNPVVRLPGKSYLSNNRYGQTKPPPPNQRHNELPFP